MNIAAALDTKLLGLIIKVFRLLQISDSRSSGERHAIESRSSLSPSLPDLTCTFPIFGKPLRTLRRSHLRTETRLLSSVFFFWLLFYSFALLLASIAGRKSFERNSPREKYFLSVYLETTKGCIKSFFHRCRSIYRDVSGKKRKKKKKRKRKRKRNGRP